MKRVAAPPVNYVTSAGTYPNQYAFSVAPIMPTYGTLGWGYYSGDELLDVTPFGSGRVWLPPTISREDKTAKFRAEQQEYALGIDALYVPVDGSMGGKVTYRSS